MALSKESQDHIEVIADESLATFATVAETAKSHLATASPSSSAAFAAINTWTSTEAVRNRERIDQDNIDGYQVLCQEPAIARVVVVDENDVETTYYICRAAPVHLNDKGINLASYRSPVGRLAALPVGADHTLRRDGQPVSVEILEHARFQPTLAGEDWDARNSVFEGDTYGPLTVESLLALLKRRGEEIDATLLDSLLGEESEAENVREGLRRSVITKMDLRDQPILDQYQDDIFRLPLDTRLLILGAPGTGKTTTLIRRLGQKLDVAFLEEDEQRAIRRSVLGEEVEHSQSWVMFTPTELLKLYVKEAFNREGIPAPDDRITTWADYRDDLARNEFSILRSASNNSSYVMKDSARTLKAETEADPIGWFSDFDQWQKSAFWDEMRAAAKNLSEHTTTEVARLGKKFVTTLDAAGKDAQPSTFVTLMSLASEIRGLVQSLKESSDKKIHGALNLQVNRDRRFLDDLAAFVEGLSEVNDDSEDQDAEEDEEPNQPRVGRAAALANYMRAVRAQARAQARKRNVAKSSRAGHVIEWLGDRSLPESDLQEVGESLVLQSALRWFVNPVRRYIDGVTARYRRYRRKRQSEKRWFRADGFNPTDINPLEIDVILLAIMRGTDDLVRGAQALGDTDSPATATLERLQRLYRTQVLVDEATDFSPIQLSCMATLARPETRSFFACGDFNQRVTNWGTRSVEQMNWVVPNIETRAISVAYRQSRKLHALARQIVSLSGGSAADVVLPDYAENEGVPPVLALHMTEELTIAAWLALRIREIEEFVRDLPSIAVLVNSEDEVRSLASALSEALTEHNIRVIACPDGQVRGRDSAVRVFNVKHIKGLEFEAVFFVGIDKLAKIRPDLFDKFLYVGVTRAATYLGMTCEQKLPTSMTGLEGFFGQSW